jgi:hypothetical protein
MNTKQSDIVQYVNRKNWWHVPTVDPMAYKKRGIFYASTYREAEFYGRPVDEPQRVHIKNPLVGDQATIERKLLGRKVSTEDISVESRFKLDARICNAALSKGYDSIVLMAVPGFRKYRALGKIPRSLELNVLDKEPVAQSNKPNQKLSGSCGIRYGRIMPSSIGRGETFCFEKFTLPGGISSPHCTQPLRVARAKSSRNGAGLQCSIMS